MNLGGMPGRQQDEPPGEGAVERMRYSPVIGVHDSVLARWQVDRRLLVAGRHPGTRSSAFTPGTVASDGSSGRANGA